MSRSVLRIFRRNDSGAIAPLYALALFALVGAAGIGFDYARIAAMDTELQNAADQAALAAATQLTREAGAKASAADAAEEFFASRGYNKTNFANDGDSDGKAVKIVTVEFYATRANAEAETNAFSESDTDAGEGDEDANFVRVVVEQRTANYALTPVVGALSGPIDAAATAGMGSSICKVPPIMICSPDPSQPFDAEDKEGMGIVATGHNTGNGNGGNGGNPGSDSQGNTWAPGDFGFLQVEDPSATAASRNQALLLALAYEQPPVDCTPVGENRVSTGNPQGLFDAINTRFDIYDFNNNSGNGNILSACYSGRCPAAQNVVKDFTNTNPNPTVNNACKIRNSGGGAGWMLPDDDEEFEPIYNSSATDETQIDDDGVIAVMGLPRDNCHYTSYDPTPANSGDDGLCSGGNGRFGNGAWARADYFAKNHPSGSRPTDWQNITRYETYLWELANSLPSVANQRSGPMCSTGTTDIDRRVLTVAVVTNCSSLHGASVPVDIDEWVDVFLVEPSIDDPVRHNAFRDAIYVEVIGPSKTAGGNTYGVQTVRRDVPYLVR